MTKFEDAYAMQLAASETYRQSGAPKVEGLSPEQLAQRAAILNISASLMIAKRNSLLDDFCRAWLTHRGLVK